MIQSYIKELVQYGLNTGLVEKEDTVYTVNALLEFFGLDEYEGELPEAKEGGMPLEEILKGMKLNEEEEFTTVHNYIDTDEMILRKGAVSAQKANA